MDGTDNGWGRPAEAAPRWRALLDRARGGRSGESSDPEDRRGDEAWRGQGAGPEGSGRRLPANGASGRGGYGAEPPPTPGERPWPGGRPARGRFPDDDPGGGGFFGDEPAGGPDIDDPAAARRLSESRYAALRELAAEDDRSGFPGEAGRPDFPAETGRSRFPTDPDEPPGRSRYEALGGWSPPGDTRYTPMDNDYRQHPKVEAPRPPAETGRPWTEPARGDTPRTEPGHAEQVGRGADPRHAEPRRADQPWLPEPAAAPRRADQPWLPEPAAAPRRADQPWLPEPAAAPRRADQPWLPEPAAAPRRADQPWLDPRLPEPAAEPRRADPRAAEPARPWTEPVRPWTDPAVPPVEPAAAGRAVPPVGPGGVAGRAAPPVGGRVPAARAAVAPLVGAPPAGAPPVGPPAAGSVPVRPALGRATPSGGQQRPAGRRQSRVDDETERAMGVLGREIDRPRVVAFANPKGGVHKTTATVLAAATIGSVRGRGVLAWDDNELRGTLGLRAGSARHARTIRHLIADLMVIEASEGPELIERLDDYLRHAPDGSYDVLAGEENSRFAHRLDQHTVRRVLDLLRRTHNVICVDTGNNVESPNWQTVLRAADQLVVTTVPREDAAFTADWMLDHLHEVGMSELADNAVTLLSCPTPGRSPLLDDFQRHFLTRTRAVAVVPYDPALETGSSIEYPQLQPETRNAWLQAAAVMVEPFVR